MLRNIIYWALAAGSLGLLFVEAPSGALLTSQPERGKVTSDPKKGSTTIRGGRAPVFIWFGGGYHGGK